MRPVRSGFQFALATFRWSAVAYIVNWPTAGI